LDGTDRERLVENVPDIDAIEIDPVHGYYYWSEFLYGTIHRTSISDNSQTFVIFDKTAFGRPGTPRELAIDPVNGYLYTTDYAFQAVIRMGLDGTNPALWVTWGVSNPDGIAVDLVHQRVIWSDYEKSPEDSVDTNISSVNFQGGDRRFDFTPLRNGFPAWVKHLALVDVSTPEPSTLAIAFAVALSCAAYAIVTPKHPGRRLVRRQRQ
jgi:hypothetical protein